MKLQVTAGATSKLLRLFIQDSTSSSGAGLTGLTNASAGLTAYYIREGAASATAISIVSATVGTFTSSGFKEVDATNMPGVYEIGIPNAAIAAGANSVLVMYKGATSMVPVLLEIQLQSMDVYDGVRAGLTALPNAVAGATGGLDCTVIFGGTASAGAATSLTLAGASAVDSIYNHMQLRLQGGTGAGQIRTIVAYNGTTKVATVDRNWTTTPDNTTVFSVTGPAMMPAWNLFQGGASAGGATSVTLSGGSATSSIYNGALVLITAGTGARQSRVCTAYNGGTGVLTVDRAWQTNPDSTSVIVILGADLPGADGAGNLSGSVASVTGTVGSVTGAVGSVTGAVGSVTGNVGGNVVGSVASVTAAVDILQSAADKVWATTTRTLTAISTTILGAVWDALRSGHTTAGSFGEGVASVQGNVTGSVGSVTAGVTVTTNNDKTSYSLANNAVDAAQFTQAAADKVWSSATRTLTAFSLTLAQSVWDVLASAVTAVNSIGLQLKTNIDATVSSRLASASYTAPPSAAAISTQVWSEPLPGAFSSGTSGNLIGNRLDAAVTTRASATDYTTARAAKLDNLDVVLSTRLATSGYTAPPSAATIAAQVIATTLSELTQAQPSATPALGDALMAIYMEWRNQTTSTSTDKKIRNAAGTVVFRAVLSDDGTTFTKAQVVAGP